MVSFLSRLRVTCVRFLRSLSHVFPRKLFSLRTSATSAPSAVSAFAAEGAEQRRGSQRMLRFLSRLRVTCVRFLRSLSHVFPRKLFSLRISATFAPSAVSACLRRS
jgi:predicted DNA-binding ribbon-helix-helix protein